MTTATQLLQLMSPTTLASLICDLRQMDNRDMEELILERTALELLSDNVGWSEAADLLEEVSGIAKAHA